LHHTPHLALAHLQNGLFRNFFCTYKRTSMRRHILSRPTWRPPCGRAQRLRVLRAMLPSALSMSPLFGDSVHRMRSVLIRTNRRRCNLRSGLCSSRGGWTKFAISQSPYARSEAIGHTGALRLGLGELCRDHHLLLRSSFCLACSFRLPGLRSDGCCAVVRRLLR
jgi:hypothetical protein